MTLKQPELARGGTLALSEEMTLDETTNDVAWPLPSRLNGITVQVDFIGGASYEVLCSANKDDTVRAGTAKWFNLFGGVQTAAKQVTIPAKFSWIRIVRTTGTLNVALYGS